MTIEVKMTNKVGTSQGVKILVYGRPGTGKTTFCGTAPRPFILSAESGLLSLRRSALPYIEVNSIEELESAYDYLMMPSMLPHYDTICLDSVSEIAEQSLAYHKSRTRDGRKAYGDYVDQMVPLLKKFRGAPKHVIASCKQGSIKDEIMGNISYAPTAPGQQLAKELPYIFDEVLNTNIGKDTAGKTFHYIRAHPDEQYEAKDRSGVLDEIEPPDASHIIAKITSNA